MGQPIQFRRGNEVNLPSLQNGEPAVTSDTGKLFYGTPQGNVEVATAAELAETQTQLSDIAINVKNKTTEQIQQIINDNHSKGTIFFSNTDTNIYTLTDTLKIPSNTSILFADDVMLKLANGVNKPLIENADKVNGNTQIKIIGGKLDMNVANQTTQTPAISMHRVTHSHFNKIEITGTKFVSYVGIGAFDMYLSDYNIIENCRVHNSGDEGLYLRECSYNKVIGGEYYDCPNGAGLSSDKGQYNEFLNVHCYRNAGSNMSINSLYSTITNCISEDNTGINGITLGHQGSPASYSTVNNCLVKNNKNGIRVLGTSVGVVVSKNVVIDNNFDTSAIGIGVSDNSSDCIVSDNYCYNNHFGIYISTGDKGSIVKGNIVKMNKGTGITINATKNTIVEGNICENNASSGGVGYGIYLSTTSRDNTISNNRCFDSQTTKTQERGIYSDGVKNIISNNIVFGNKTAQLSATAGNFLSNNILSDTALMRFDVTLNDTTSTVISNANINADSKISFIPKTATAVDRKIYQSAIANGSVTLTHLAGTGDIISVSIN